MDKTLSLQLQPTQKASLQQTQRLMMLPQMQQALAILQLPVLELAQAMELEMEQNPLLEFALTDANPGEEEQEPEETAFEELSERELTFEEKNFEVLKLLDEEFRDHFSQDEALGTQRTTEEEKRKTYLDESMVRQESLREFLLKQSREFFSSSNDRALAELLIGSLDEHGFLATPLSELALLFEKKEEALARILKGLQTFDPPGIAARDLQDSLLHQLRRQGKEPSLAFTLVAEHWDDLLHHRLPLIAKKLACSPSMISQCISRDIAPLDLHPGKEHAQRYVQALTPDLIVRLEGDNLLVGVNEDPLPSFRFNRHYLRMLEDPSLSVEAKDFIKQKLCSANWLRRTVDQRQGTLQRIGEFLLKAQKDFFDLADGQLKPLTMKTVAEELGVAESTIARAVANKYLYSPRGMHALRSFFTHAYSTDKGQDISSRTVRDALEALIAQENKRKPLSDDALSHLLKEQGITCARRTIAKYRSELNIGNAQQRRAYF